MTGDMFPEVAPHDPDAADGSGDERYTQPSTLAGRPRFGHPGNPSGIGVGSPQFGCVLLLWRR